MAEPDAAGRDDAGPDEFELPSAELVFGCQVPLLVGWLAVLVVFRPPLFVAWPGTLVLLVGPLAAFRWIPGWTGITWRSRRRH